MKVLVCGGRDLKLTYKQIQDVMFAVCETTPAMIIHGDASGVDESAETWAVDSGVPYKAYPAKWEKFGKAAGPIRNRQMLALEQPDVVVAFWDGKSRGTKNMIDLAIKAGVPVYIKPSQPSDVAGLPGM